MDHQRWVNYVPTLRAIGLEPSLTPSVTAYKPEAVERLSSGWAGLGWAALGDVRLLDLDVSGSQIAGSACSGKPSCRMCTFWEAILVDLDVVEGQIAGSEHCGRLDC